MKWFRMYGGLVDDPQIGSLSDSEFRSQFILAIHGYESLFSKYTKIYEGRISWGIWKHIRSNVFERDKYTCQYCKQKKERLECDHIIPLSRGGSHNLNNLITACFSCNRSKQSKLPLEWKPYG